MTSCWKPGDPVPHVHDQIPELLAAAGLAPESVRALLDFDVANFQWYRLVQKGEMMQAILRKIGTDLDLPHVQALLALIRIEAGVGRAATEPTIGLVAGELGVDPSRASRLVADLVAGGYVRRGVAQEDGRRSVLALSDRGYGVLDKVRREKWAIMVRVFRDWDPDTIAHFARGIRAYAEGVQAAITDLETAAT